MEISQEDTNLFVKTIFDLSGYDFSGYSVKSLNRRIEKILGDYHYEMPQLIARIKSNPLLIESIIKSITVNTTELFRDPSIWLKIEEEVIPVLKEKERIKIWHPGCSSGQEPYSMLILLNEYGLLGKTEILATDLNSDVLNNAKKGLFRYFLDAEYLKNFDAVFNSDPSVRFIPYEKYFLLDAQRDIFMVKPEFLNKIHFYKHDIICDSLPDLNSFDIIMCRNLLIYFNMDLQNKIIYGFYKALKMNGFLILGYHESLLGSIATFFNKNEQLYTKAK
jgi:chemotaxis protein methyltransferase CheR